ncbi:hypothetical protein CCH79_00020121 [Gambusia affinis]|uniref:RRM domain-containing protein n=1 Tax=Gambusia affinis TaxID=33528 RepID=A0A315UY54_GAMAF|nr:hypothetical protein CCH79_00020121 [Gambusia affinis]
MHQGRAETCGGPGAQKLKRSLYALFSQFGQIVDIVAMKTMRMRGQAFVVFKELTAATNALRQLQGFPFYNKPMYAKTDSEVISKMKGTFSDKEKKKEKKKKAQEAAAAANAAKKPSAALAVPAQTPAVQVSRLRSLEPVLKLAADPSNQNPAQNIHGFSLVYRNLNNRTVLGGTTRIGPFRTNPSLFCSQVPDNPPNHILFLNNLPEETNEMMLSMLFNQFPGFKEVRLVPGKHDIAFVEFESETQGGVAKDALQGFRITATCAMKITYAKKLVIRLSARREGLRLPLPLQVVLRIVVRVVARVVADEVVGVVVGGGAGRCREESGFQNRSHLCRCFKIKNIFQLREDEELQNAALHLHFLPRTLAANHPDCILLSNRSDTQLWSLVLTLVFLPNAPMNSLHPPCGHAPPCPRLRPLWEVFLIVPTLIWTRLTCSRRRRTDTPVAPPLPPPPPPPLPRSRCLQGDCSPGSEAGSSCRSKQQMLRAGWSPADSPPPSRGRYL